MLIYTIKVGELLTNCYLAACAGTLQCYIIDPGDQAEKILSALKKHRLKPLAIINTHAHPDHVGANFDLKRELAIPVYAHRGTKAMFQAAGVIFRAMGYSFKVGLPDEYVDEGRVFAAGSIGLRVLYTPGHAPGSICLYDGQQNLFAGDTLFKDGFGRVDLPGGSFAEMSRSLKEKLFKLPKSTVVYPGHGPKTTLQAEERNLARELV